MSPIAQRRRQLIAFMQPDRLAGQTVLVFGIKIFNAAASFGFSLLIARAFGATGSGQFGIAVTTVTVLSYVALCGMDYTIVRVVAGDVRQGKLAQARGVISAAVGTVAVFAPALALVLWLARSAFAERVLHQPYMADVLSLMLWAGVPLALQRVASAALRSTGNVIVSQLVDGPLGTGLALVGLSLAIVSHRANTILLPAGIYVVALCIGATMGWLLYRRAVAGWPASERSSWLPLAIAGLPLLALNLSNVFTEWYTTVVLSGYWPAAVVGQYRVAWQFVSLAGLLQVAMDTMLGPRIAAAHRSGARNEIIAVARKSIVLVLLLATPLFVMLVFCSKQLLGIFGAEFQGGETAMQILAAGQLFRLASGPLGTIIVMTGSQRWSVIYTVLGVFTCMVLVALLVPRYGAAGAAIATGMTVVVRNLIGGIIVHRVIGINLFSREPASH